MNEFDVLVAKPSRALRRRRSRELYVRRKTIRFAELIVSRIHELQPKGQG